MTATAPADRGRVLVVDDEDPIALLLVALLSGEGYHVERAASFAQVQERFAAAGAAFDVVTLDVIMPGANGIEVLRWLRQEHPDVGVVMATALGDLDTVLSAMRLGAQNYIVKPFNLDLVSQEIARAMERQRLIAENRSYQRDLERKVEAQTRQLRAAYAELERRVRELEGRDQLVCLQLDGVTRSQARDGILRVFTEVLAPERAVLYRPVAQGRLEVVAPDDADCSGPDPAVVVAACQSRVLEEDGTAVAVPLVYHDEVLGVLLLTGVKPAPEIRAEVLACLSRLAGQAAALLLAARITEELDSGQVQVDELLRME